MKSTILKMMLAVAVFLPLSLFAQAATHHNDLTWVPGAGGGSVTGFNIKKASVTGGPYLTITSVASSILAFSDTSNLVEGQHNFYVITATGPGGESAPSNEVNLLTPFSLPTKPALSGTAF